jgi:hypothetical protein
VGFFGGGGWLVFLNMFAWKREYLGFFSFKNHVGASINQCCGSGMFIPDPDFSHLGSQISDPKSNNNNKEEGENLVVLIFFVNFTDLNFFYRYRQLFLAN